MLLDLFAVERYTHLENTVVVGGLDIFHCRSGRQRYGSGEGAITEFTSPASTIFGPLLSLSRDADAKDRIVDRHIDVFVGVDARHLRANHVVVLILVFLDADRRVGDEVVVQI